MLKVFYKIFSIFFYIICFAIILWVLVSYIDVLMHNINMENYVYPSWNIFARFL